MKRSFEEDFEALTEFPPFRWQQRLYNQFLEGNLPSALDLPTGLGKTSVMAIWLIAMAAGANLPRRLVYVVDRRAVVDQATRFAEQLREKMSGKAISRFAEQLGPGAEGTLPISTLRGGFVDNREWLEDPSRPAIVVGTVDMVGSRLLFEGYGVSRGMRPYYAGFLGVDSLVVLDEAHLCLPFEQLLRTIAEHRDGKFGPVGSGTETRAAIPPFRLMSLSATGRDLPVAQSSADDVPIFRLEEDDRADEVVEQRLTAHKRLVLSEIDEPTRLPEKLAQRAVPLGYGDEPEDGAGSSPASSPARVLVYCHSRQDAAKVKEVIDKEIKARAKANPDAAEAVSELLVGERRNYERRILEKWLDRYGFFGGVNAPDVPIFLIATSAGEVGVDIDADHMVCDLVAYERMVQRLGRVNRRGDAGRNAVIEVVAVVPRDKEDSDWFNAKCKAITSLPRNGNGSHDASPWSIKQLRSTHTETIEHATTPVPLYPELTRAHLEAWAMTSLKDHEGRTEVAPWLRGWIEDEEPQVNVVWRVHLPHRQVGNETTALPNLVTAFFQSASVHASEKLEAPVDRVFKWLMARAKAVDKRPANEENSLSRDAIVSLVFNHAGDYVYHASLGDLLFLGRSSSTLSKPDSKKQKRAKDDWKRRLAGATIVVDSRIGGLSDGLLNDKANTPVATADADEDWKAEQEEADGTIRPVVKFRVEATVADEEGLDIPDLGEWRPVGDFETVFNAGGGVQRGLIVYKWAGELGEEESTSVLSSPQTLQAHAKQVAKRVCEMANRVGLPSEEIEALEKAALTHDDGKEARRWQDAMNAPRDGRPYAKTTGGGNWRLLEGYRHEFGSLLKAEQMQLPEETGDLILHLIASHHGHARPVLPTAGCEEGPPSLLEARAGDAALRFARLQKQYGIWGLAWREAILRAADQTASREWDTRSRGQARNG